LQKLALLQEQFSAQFASIHFSSQKIN